MGLAVFRTNSKHEIVKLLMGYPSPAETSHLSDRLEIIHSESDVFFDFNVELYELYSIVRYNS